MSVLRPEHAALRSAGWLLAVPLFVPRPAVSTRWCTHDECRTEVEHLHCPSCGAVLPGAARGLCSHHESALAEGWAAGNRILCDYLHRGKVPPRLSVIDRTDEFATHDETA